MSVLSPFTTTVTQPPLPTPHSPVSHVDAPICPASAYSVTNEAIAEIRRVDDSFHNTVKNLVSKFLVVIAIRLLL